MEPMKLRRSEKGTLGRMSGATKALQNSADGHGCRADLCIVEVGIPMRECKARAGSSTLVNPGRRDSPRGVEIEGRTSPSPGVF